MNGMERLPPRLDFALTRHPFVEGPEEVAATHEWYMARFCKRVLVIRDRLLVRDEPVKDRLYAPDELRIVQAEERAVQLTGAT